MKRLLIALGVVICGEGGASAHALDQILQAARIELMPGAARVELRVVPGAELAVFGEIDADGNGEISSEEGQRYARRVLRDLSLQLDGRPLPLSLTGAAYPSREEMNEGNGAFRLTLVAPLDLGAGDHQVVFRNDHRPDVSVYLVNPLVPSTEGIAITGQRRDILQRSITLGLRVLASPLDRPRAGDHPSSH